MTRKRKTLAPPKCGHEELVAKLHQLSEDLRHPPGQTIVAECMALAYVAGRIDAIIGEPPSRVWDMLGPRERAGSW